MKKYTLTYGAYLHDCACGCGTPIHERIWRTKGGGIGCRSQPRFAPNHSLHVNRADRTGVADISPAMRGRRALILPLGPELHETIQRRRQELGLSVVEMLTFLGWKGKNNLGRYKFKPNVMRSTLHGLLDRLYADEGGWVEAGKLWALVRERQAYWGMTDAEMNASLGAAEARWIGKATARRILLTLTAPRRPCEFEQIRTQRERVREERAQYRAKATERQAS